MPGSAKHWKTLAISAVFITVSSWTISGTEAAVTFDWATVGNAGNAAHPTSGRGRVNYEYRISKYEVTNAQYSEFLNAVAVSDPANLYSTNMASDARGGITRSGSSGSYSYTVKTNMADKPVNYVSWLDAARFVNWLHNGQGSASTDSGVYAISSTGLSETRSADAQYFLPSQHEWYKAAWHQPADQGGPSSHYWLYATGSNMAPTAASANGVGDISNPGTNVANYNLGADWNSQDGNVTTLGSAGADSASYYGTFDQNGNVTEWNEALLTMFGTFHPTRRGIWGGSWSDDEIPLRATYKPGGNWPNYTPGTERNDLGFRVASPIPEPASLALMALGATLLLRRQRGSTLVLSMGRLKGT